MLKDLFYQVARLVVALGLGVGIGLWLGQRPTAPIGEAVVATTAPELKNVGTETRPCAPVKVYTASAKKKLDMPKAVQDNPNQQVTASISLPADLYPHRITSVADLGTGETKVYDQRLERPWLALNPRGYIGVGYGQNQDGRAVRLAASQSVVDIKSFTIAGDASYDFGAGRNTWFVGVMAKRPW
jgi:hypothetical protein